MEIMWKDVTPTTWENAEQSEPTVLTLENAELVGGPLSVENLIYSSGLTVTKTSWGAARAYNDAILACESTEHVSYINVLNWENAEQLETPVLAISSGFYLYKAGGEYGAGDNYGWSAGYSETLDETFSGAAPGTFIIRETKSISVLPISASIGIAMGFMVLAAWVGYRRMWGDAATTLLEQGLHDMTVRDVEIVGQIMDLKEFTIPELVRRTRASKITVWRTVQKLIKQGLVHPTERTKLAANGLGGRGKPSRVYKYVGAHASEKPTKR
jgi:predicted transcriptional regulator